MKRITLTLVVGAFVLNLALSPLVWASVQTSVHVSAQASTQTLDRASVQPTVQASVWTLSFQSPESLNQLARTPYKTAFLALANHYKPQENRFYCGITTAVIVLNALRSNPGSDVVRPLDHSKFDAKDPSVLPPMIPILPNSPTVPVFERYTETTFFNSRTDQIKTKEQVYGFENTVPGVSLEQLHQMLLAHDVDSTFHKIDQTTDALSVVHELKRALGTPGHFVIVNYFRAALGQGARRGHFSPLGAYDEVSDSFLILDVTPNVHGWSWAQSSDLVAAMAFQDPGDLPRGYLILKEGSPLRKVLN